MERPEKTNYLNLIELGGNGKKSQNSNILHGVEDG
jgi:hypothetical protein